LYESSTDPTRVLSSDEAAIINQTLRAVVDEGSGVKAKLDDGRQVAGKTGTTQNARDAWFVGYTPKNCCVVAVWMGYAKSNAPMTKVHGRRVTGGAFPADIFGRFMNAQVANVDTGEFAEPDEGATGEVIEPKLSAKPVKKKKPKPTVVDSVVDTTVAPLDGDEGPVPVGSEPPTPRPEPVPAGEPGSGANPPDAVPTPEPTPEPEPVPEPVKPKDPAPTDPGPVDPSPPPVVVDAPLPTLAP
jgi:penicillin-binding protein 1A